MFIVFISDIKNSSWGEKKNLITGITTLIKTHHFLEGETNPPCMTHTQASVTCPWPPPYPRLSPSLPLASPPPRHVTLHTAHHVLWWAALRPLSPPAASSSLVFCRWCSTAFTTVFSGMYLENHSDLTLGLTVLHGMPLLCACKAPSASLDSLIFGGKSEPWDHLSESSV